MWAVVRSLLTPSADANMSGRDWPTLTVGIYVNVQWEGFVNDNSFCEQPVPSDTLRIMTTSASQIILKL